MSAPPVHHITAVSLNDTAVPEAEFSPRVLIKSIIRRPDGGACLAGQTVRIGGWVKTGRKQGKGSFAFLEVNDGSCPANLQLMVQKGVCALGELVHTGTCLHVQGVLKSPPEGAEQKIELRVVKVLRLGPVDPAKYPLPKTTLTLEFLRDYTHLRPRTYTISAIARISNALDYATHIFFQTHGFLHIRTPIITTSDCEGAGEMFQVTTLIRDADKLEKELIERPPPSEADAEDLRTAVAELKKAKENLSKVVERSKLKPGIRKAEDGKIDYSQDFFARQAFLTVSGQLQVETYACALCSVYTFGPTFRAENSHTSRHLAEFWMVEPEIAFADLQDVMKCAEAYVKFLCQWLLDHCLDDMEIMVKNIDKTAIDRLRRVVSSNFVRITYTKAVDILKKVPEAVKKFEKKVEWGVDLASEHERYLTEEEFKCPVIVYDYPKGIKAFYMKLNDDNKTVAAMDVLMPKVGELIGGSQREENYEVLVERMLEMGIDLEPYQWYLDLRRYGSVEHGGFGLGFERMILFATGMDNIRDVIPFPRYPGKADL